MKYIITIIIIIATTLPMIAAESQTSLMENCEKARSLSQYEELEKYSAQLLAQSRQSGNNRNEAYACFYNGLAKMFLGDVDKSQQLLDQAEDIATKIENDSVRALVYNTKGIYHALVKSNTFVAQQYFFKSLQLASQVNYIDLQYRVRSNLLTLSHSTGGDFDLENAQKVYDHGVKTGNNEHISLGSYHLATYYFEHKDIPSAEKYLKIALETYRKHSYQDIASVYSLYAKVETSRNNLPRAEELARQAIALAQEHNQQSLEVDARITCAEVLEKRGNCNDAIGMVKSAIDCAQEIEMTSKAVACNEIMARCYIKLGNKDEALKHMQQANKLLNEQSMLNVQRVSYEQQVLHEMEQKEMDAKVKQEQIAAQRQFLIMMGIVLAVLISLLVVTVISYRRRQTLYKKIVKQNTQAIAKQEHMQEKIETLVKENQQLKASTAQQQETAAGREPQPADAPTIDDDKMNELYNKLCHLMDNERLFTEPQLTREKMAERLGTNRTYLTRVIKEKTGMSYLQYVNSYRINEALKILSDRDKVNYPLKQIWADLGFSSPSTFFKVFQQTVGITPTIYRKQFLEVTDDTPEDDEE